MSKESACSSRMQLRKSVGNAESIVVEFWVVESLKATLDLEHGTFSKRRHHEFSSFLISAARSHTHASTFLQDEFSYTCR